MKINPFQTDNLFTKQLAIVLAFSMLFQLILPTASFALTSGPTQPEFTSFEPVATTNMVNEFSGDFTYNLPVINIPGPEGGGYSMSLSYHSGVSVEQEASWVGLGWTLNPGAINRNKRGFPDDWSKSKVTYFNQAPANRTVALNGNVGAEFFSFDKLPINLSANASVRYNNYKGFGFSFGISAVPGAKGVSTLGYSFSDDGSKSFNWSISTAKLLQKKAKQLTEGEQKESDEYFEGITGCFENTSEGGKELLNDIAAASIANGQEAIGTYPVIGGNRKVALSSNYGIASLVEGQRPLQSPSYSGNSFVLDVSILPTPFFVPAGPKFGFGGSYSVQKNVEVQDLETFGYMYSSEAYANNDYLMDYYMEKENAYDVQDKHIGMPVSNSDIFQLTGEGLTGSFRLHNKTDGYFRPNHQSSATNHFAVKPQLHVGFNIGVGGSVSYGRQILEVEKWKINKNFDGYADQGAFFRFANDLGGYIEMGDDEKIRAALKYKLSSKLVDYEPVEISSHNVPANVGRSSNIAFRTINERLGVNNNVNYKQLEKNSIINSSDFAELDGTNMGKQLAEFSIDNEDGNSYNYGLPVYSKNEVNINYTVRNQDAVAGGLRASKSIDLNNFSNSDYVIGEKRDDPYATAYLLTSITTPDYVDLQNDGPTQDDFGGWTKFEYERLYGQGQKWDTPGYTDHNEWFKWRMPYNNLQYNRGKFADTDDDLGSVSYGEKEVYYLNKIETKTHFAEFITSDRPDGVDADHSETNASTSSSAKGSNQLKKLDKINLYAKQGDNNVLIKTVHFEYEQELMEKIPNSVNPAGADDGKLTLKRVWFEYGNVKNVGISPYVFNYTYPQVTYPGKYAHLQMGSNYNNENQNPDYNVFQGDAWGNYSGLSETESLRRFKANINWPFQGTRDANYDPAAWNLKQIILPSGGEIHVQYEQDDYRYVQDKLAHAMVGLAATSPASDYNFHLDLPKDLGIAYGSPEATELKRLIEEHYKNADKKMYFKFLYRLIADRDASPDNCQSDYISGYAGISSVNSTSTYFSIQLNPANTNELPVQVCKDYVKKNHMGKNNPLKGCDSNSEEFFSPNGDAKDFLAKFVSWLRHGVTGSTCINRSNEYSFLKVPMPIDKKGGGIRVKRLLMYDDGSLTGSPELYGSEYSYSEYDAQQGVERSTGVATFEPSSMREENPIVGFMDRFKQSFISKAVSGINKEQAEGPVGESVMPAPSVGYSKITIKNIHQGKSNNAYEVKEFYTAKDYPVQVDMTGIDKRRLPSIPLSFGVGFLSIDNTWLSQGFTVKRNSMHGKPKSTATYSSSYNGMPEYPISSQTFEYFSPEEKIPIMHDFGNYGLQPLGKSMETVHSSKRISDRNYEGALDVDVSISLFLIPLPPYIWPVQFTTFWPSFSYIENETYTHTTSKIIDYPSVVKRIVSTNEGYTQITENKYFDPNTGKPSVIVKNDSYNGLQLMGSTHNGTYTTFNISAASQYSGMGQKAISERIKRSATGNLYMSEQNGVFTYSGALSTIPNGSLIELNEGSKTGLFYVISNEGGQMQVQKPSYAINTITSPFNGSVEVLESGKSNQLNDLAGSFTVYGNVEQLTSGLSGAQLTSRNSIISSLNTLALNGTSLNGSSISDLLIKENGNCHSFPGNYTIKIEGNSLNIYKAVTNRSTQVKQVVGTPQVPHPMVQALNDYLNTYYNYQLNNSLEEIAYSCNFIDDCEDKSSYVGHSVDNQETNLDQMRQDQVSDLGQTFDYINGLNQSISDVITDHGFNHGSSFFIDDNNGLVENKTVLLEEISTGLLMGSYADCYDDRVGMFVGCGNEITNFNSYFDCEFPSDILTFGQTQDGFLYYDFNDQICQTQIQFYDWVTVQNASSELAHSFQFQKTLGAPAFTLNTNTGDILINYSDNTTEVLLPNVICKINYPSLANVVKTSAVKYSDNWVKNGYENYSYQYGNKGKWKSYSNYVYKTDQVTGINGPYNPSMSKNYNTGLFTMDYFNWNSSNSTNWIETSRVLRYDNNGHPLEEIDALGIKSTAKYSYHATGQSQENDGILPYLIAKNAGYDEVIFETFETKNANTNGGKDYDNELNYSGLTESNPHSGNGAILWGNSSSPLYLGQIKISESMSSEGLVARMWLKTNPINPEIISNSAKIQLQDGDDNELYELPIKLVSKSGDWALYECVFSNISSGDIESYVNVKLIYDFSQAKSISIDDVCIHAADAMISGYIYDPNSFRLIASFDNQLYGMYYAYDGSGKLITKIIETEKGMKMTGETNYNLPTESR